MKTKFILFAFLLCMNCDGYSQYLGVRARYVATRLVDNPPNAASRENRLILSFYSVSGAGVYTPVTLTNYDLYIYKGGLQYGSLMGGVLDSAGNNYPGYSYTAPAVCSYYNSMGIGVIDCNPNITDHYIVNGHELDCGWIGVSYWLYDEQADRSDEYFTAPNICLPYYFFPSPYYFSPGNVNFAEPVPAGPPYNHYNFSCAGSSLQLVHRGVLPQDTATTLLVPLAVGFANVSAVRAGGSVRVGFSNMTETGIDRYEVERSANGVTFTTAAVIFPFLNNGSRADYTFTDSAAVPGRLFYRIKAIEQGGRIKFSAVAAVDAATTTEGLSVFPNPVTDHHLTFRINNAAKGLYRVQVVNAVGQVSFTKMLQHNGGLFSGALDLPVTLRGIYYLTVQSPDSTFSNKILLR